MNSFFIIITGIGLGINTIFIWSFTELFGLYFMLSKLLATFATYWWNFGARKYFLQQSISYIEFKKITDNHKN